MDALRDIRRRRGWSQKDLADASGVGQDTISGIESGRHEPRPSTLRKLARALDVEVADFFREPALPKVETPPAPQPSFNDILEEERQRELSLEDVRTLLTERIGSHWLALPDEEWDTWWKGVTRGVPREEVVNRYRRIRDEWELVMHEFDTLIKGGPTSLPRGGNIMDVYNKLFARRWEARYLVPQPEESDREFQKRRLNSQHFRAFYEELQQEQQEASEREKRAGA